ALLRKFIERVAVRPQHRPRRHGIDAHFRAQFARQGTRQPDQRGLRHTIDNVILERTVGVDVDDVDDTTARLAQIRCRRLRQEQRGAHVHAHQVVPRLFGNAADRRGIKGRGIVHHHVEPTEARHCRFNDFRQCGRPIEVRLHRRHGFGMHTVQFGLQDLRLGSRRVVVQHETRVRRMELPRDRGADTFGTAGHQHHLAGQILRHAASALLLRELPILPEARTIARAMPHHDTLPEPSSDASAHSARLVQHIREHIDEAGGWIPFSQYMKLALYAPELGYYTAGSRKLGKDGDFTTAPELTPLFGQALAQQARQLIDDGLTDILEIGAGSGVLAAAMLEELERLDALPERYLILELSPELRARERDTLAARVPHLMERVAWLNQLPPAFSGLVLGNEVLDAMPVEIVRTAD